jgi:hypothetical protein
MNLTLKLPTALGTMETYRVQGTPLDVRAPVRPFNRIAYSAAHVVADPPRAGELNAAPAIDWDRTLGYRRYLLQQGLGIAEAMDTAQRGMGLPWSSALELITRTIEGTRDIPGALIASGVGTDHVAPASVTNCDQVICAYAEQLEAVQRMGGRVILMASRALARVARSQDDYRRVYREVLAMCDQPVILHWLGEMFDPALTGYWGGETFEQAAANVLEIIGDAGAMVDVIKLSLLDAAKEVWLRRELPAGVRMYTGDDFNYGELIEGDERGHSDALLGALAAITVPAAEALAALDAGDNTRYRAIIEPTLPLSRTLFEAPTYEYKAGIAFIAWLNGLQPEFAMVDGFERRRSDEHLIRVFKLAAAAGALVDPELAVERMSQHLEIAAAP